MTAELPPNDATLRRFLLGDLPPTELEAVGRYLDDHPHVASTLVEMKADDTLLSALRGPAEASDVPEVAAAVARAAGLVGGAPPTQSLAATPSADATAAPDAPDADDPDDLLAALAPAEADGELGRLGGYRVLRLLGRGGMGAVFEAADDRLGRRVALKVMLPALAARPSARQRFLREAKAAAAVEHDHIVPIYQTGEDRGVPFLAMPLLAGETLDDRLKGGRPLAVADIVRIGREVAEGLAAAHAAGLVHRDIKPSNVWLERTAAGAFKRTRILDFGLARSATGADGLTQSGTVLGTPAYMAPEQARGEAVDARADLFSLGVVLYQAATGRRPFPGADTFSILTALATTEPAPAASVNPALPAELSTLITRLLSKNPAARPQSARDVADELARLAAEPVRESATQVIGVGAGDRSMSGGDTTEAFDQAPRRRAPRRRWRVAAAVLFLAVAGLAAANGKTVVRVVTNQGELVVEVDDPATEVAVKGGAVELRREENGKKRVYLVTATKDGEVEVREPGSDTVLVMEKFQVRRGGDVLVKVTAEKLAAARPPKAAPGQPNQQATAPLTLAQRAAVEWVLANDGIITVFKDGRDVTVGRAENPLKRLPLEPLPVVGVRFYGGFPLTAAARSVLAELPPTVWFFGLLGDAATNADLDALTRQPWFAGVETVRLYGPHLLTDAGLAHLTRATKLKDVALVNLPLVTDRGLESLRALPLVTLGIQGMPKLTGTFLKADDRWQSLAGFHWDTDASLRDAELSHLAGYPALKGVSLRGDRVTDASLDRLAKCQSLDLLNLKQTKVTKAGVEKLAAARPAMRIEWDGPTVEPKARPWFAATGAPPARNAVPGDLLFYDTFDDAKTGSLPLQAGGPVRTAVRDGKYTTTIPAGKGVRRSFLDLPAAGAAGAGGTVVLRAKTDGGVLWMNFRQRQAGDREWWLLFNLNPDGSWRVASSESVREKGAVKWLGGAQLAASAGPVPELAGKWVDVAARWSDAGYDLYLNGTRVAGGPAGDPPGTAPTARPAGVKLGLRVEHDGPAGYELDHAAVWRDAPTPRP